jgi:hypothetical protein
MLQPASSYHWDFNSALREVISTDYNKVTHVKFSFLNGLTAQHDCGEA